MQRTIGAPVSISGIGLHTGCEVGLTLKPAPVDTGIVFRRSDLQHFEIPALRQYVSRVVLATTLMRRGVMLSTVEHLLSALYGLGIDNLYLDIDSLEVPIMDGSAQPFVQLVESVGIVEQESERSFLKVEQPIMLREGDKYISVTPADDFRVGYQIDFDHPVIGQQTFEAVPVTPQLYSKEIAFARTFGFYAEVEQLRRSNLIRGGSLDNAVVLTDEGVMNGELRSPDEFVRHKVLDLIGDVALCGYPLLGHIEAYKAGHALHTDLATALVRQQGVGRIVRRSELASCA